MKKTEIKLLDIFDCAEKEEIVMATKDDLNLNLDTGWALELHEGVPAFFPYTTQHPAPKMPAGSYTIMFDRNRGVYFQRKAVSSDKLILIEGSPADQVLHEVAAFVARKAEFVKRGFLHKRGIMLLGDPGAGKSATINVVASSIALDMDGIVLYMNNSTLATAGLQRLRAIEPTRLVMLVMEDIDKSIDEDDEEEILGILDGDNQVDNVVYIATTNYPEKLPPRISDRPSRFDTVVFVDLPSDQMRAEFLRSKEKEYTQRDIDQILSLTKGFTIAHLKEFIILNKCFGHSIENAAKRITDARGNKLFVRKEKK